MRDLKTLCFGILLLLCGCSGFVPAGHYTFVSTKDFQLSNAHRYVEVTNVVSGVDRDHIIIIIPTGIPKEHRAVRDALSSVDGAVALKDVTIRYKTWYIPYIYGRMWYEAEGHPIIDPLLLNATQTDSRIGNDK